MMLRKLPLCLLLWSACLFRSAAADLVNPAPAPGDFLLADAGNAAPLVCAPDEDKAVRRAVSDLAADLERVTGAAPAVHAEAAKASGVPVLVGTLGRSAWLDALVADGKLDVAGVQGEWESHVIQVVDAPLPGVSRALVIAGSDRRGTIYGVYTLSEAIGVSPWAWWADVPVARKDTLAVRTGAHKQGPPAVRYRGIFLNDEDWGLQPWAAKTFEPETGDIGPKTYAKIFELLLRLRGNYVWPAMHPCTRAFNFYPDNKRVADEYGIVMGASHCEQMLRNNVDEWHRDGHGEYNYVTNRDGVLRYWETRVKENAAFENLYTVGMRGIHDSGMPGGGTLAEQAERLRTIIADQRELLRRWVNPAPARVPQIFCPYKEVLEIYREAPDAIPDDITLVWPDDNFGYVRQFSSATEQRRLGGAGVYYHLSYWGRPHDYLWLASTSPALVWLEMTKAYDYGARTAWIGNVGDIKPAEWLTEFFLRLAWNPRQWAPDRIHDFLRENAARDFGPAHAEEIAAILDEYYRLNFIRRPEHMGYDPKHAYLSKPTFAMDPDNDEAAARLAAWESLAARASTLGEQLAPEQRAAYFQLVLYPVRSAALMNAQGLHLFRAQALAAQDRAAEAGEYLGRAHNARATIDELTAYYNEQLSGGKWRHMMSAAPRNLGVFKVPDSLAPVGASLADARSDSRPASRIVVEAEAATERVAGADGAAWKTVPGVGYNGAAVTVLPTTTASRRNAAQLASAPVLQYQVQLDAPGNYTLTVRTLPHWPLEAGRAARYAIAVDDAPPQFVELPLYRDEKDPAWSRDVLRNASETMSVHSITSPGGHVVKIWMADPGITIDALMLTPAAGSPLASNE